MWKTICRGTNEKKRNQKPRPSREERISTRRQNNIHGMHRAWRWCFCQWWWSRRVYLAWLACVLACTSLGSISCQSMPLRLAVRAQSLDCILTQILSGECTRARCIPHRQRRERTKRRNMVVEPVSEYHLHAYMPRTQGASYLTHTTLRVQRKRGKVIAVLYACMHGRESNMNSAAHYIHSRGMATTTDNHKRSRMHSKRIIPLFILDNDCVYPLELKQESYKQ